MRRPHDLTDAQLSVWAGTYAFGRYNPSNFGLTRPTAIEWSSACLGYGIAFTLSRVIGTPPTIVLKNLWRSHLLLLASTVLAAVRASGQFDSDDEEQAALDTIGIYSSYQSTRDLFAPVVGPLVAYDDVVPSGPSYPGWFFCGMTVPPLGLKRQHWYRFVVPGQTKWSAWKTYNFPAFSEPQLYRAVPINIRTLVGTSCRFQVRARFFVPAPRRYGPFSAPVDGVYLEPVSGPEPFPG